MPTVKQCCCGCSLRTGTLLLLWSGLIYGSLTTVSLGGFFVEKGKTSFLEILIYALVTGSYLTIYVAGICGVLKKRPSLLIPFLGLTAASLAITIITMGALVILFILMFTSPSIFPAEMKQDAPFAIIGTEIVLLIQGVIGYHYFAVVLSFYKQLKEERGIVQC